MNCIIPGKLWEGHYCSKQARYVFRGLSLCEEHFGFAQILFQDSPLLSFEQFVNVLIERIHRANVLGD